MKNLSKLTIATGLLAVFQNPAWASNCAVDEYDHNGSLMEVMQCDNELVISYIKPKAVLLPYGVRNGTLLFEGDMYSQRSEGTARLFSKKCGELKYQVEGHLGVNKIVLKGQAPKFDSQCRVVGYRPDTLVFDLVNAPLINQATQPPASDSGNHAATAPPNPPSSGQSSQLPILSPTAPPK